LGVLYFKGQGIRLNIVTKLEDGSIRSIGGPYGSTFLHLKGVKRSEKEFNDLFGYICG
jgi:hypothetical protein